MPIYEYVCDDCGAHYERIVMSQKQSITCPKCESAKHTIQLSVFAAPANGSKASGGSSSGPASGSGDACCGGGCGCNWWLGPTRHTLSRPMVNGRSRQANCRD